MAQGSANGSTRRPAPAPPRPPDNETITQGAPVPPAARRATVATTNGTAPPPEPPAPPEPQAVSPHEAGETLVSVQFPLAPTPTAGWNSTESPGYTHLAVKIGDGDLAILLRRIKEGLQNRVARLSNGSIIKENPDVIRWMLEQVAAGLEKERAADSRR